MVSTTFLFIEKWLSLSILYYMKKNKLVCYYLIFFTWWDRFAYVIFYAKAHTEIKSLKKQERCSKSHNWFFFVNTLKEGAYSVFHKDERIHLLKPELQAFPSETCIKKSALMKAEFCGNCSLIIAFTFGINMCIMGKRIWWFSNSQIQVCWVGISLEKQIYKTTLCDLKF